MSLIHFDKDADPLLSWPGQADGTITGWSPAARELVVSPLALAASAKLLHKASTFRLHLSQVISVCSSSLSQKLHQDEVAWDVFPFLEDPMVAIREPETKGVFDFGMIVQEADKDADARCSSPTSPRVLG